MFDKPEMPSFETNYLFFPDEAYCYADTYQEAVHFMKYIASEEEELSDDENFLVIEIPEGVFIRTHSTSWCKKLSEIASQKEVPIKIVGVKKWADTTRKYRAPVNSFGDNKLAIWRVGF